MIKSQCLDINHFSKKKKSNLVQTYSDRVTLKTKQDVLFDENPQTQVLLGRISQHYSCFITYIFLQQPSNLHCLQIYFVLFLSKFYPKIYKIIAQKRIVFLLVAGYFTNLTAPLKIMVSLNSSPQYIKQLPLMLSSSQTLRLFLTS